MQRYVQIAVDGEIWYEFKLECRRHNSTVPMIFEQLITQQLAVWQAERKKGRKFLPPVTLAKDTTR